ncbi:MAG: sigma-70 family RNA polymerase sigma factor [Phycisphaerales bacterium]|nr:sigma-70 family RNA polymerase sigma factor [Phycisphaerales bacterium]
MWHNDRDSSGAEWMSGSQTANFEDYFQRDYEQLREVARRFIRGERPDHTWQGTELVHEAFMKLCAGEPFSPANREHFFRVMCNAMERLLIERARAKAAEKRGGDQCRPPARTSLEAVSLAEDGNLDQFLAVESALSRLEQLNPHQAQLVRLRFYAGLNVSEAANALEMPKRTVEREWEMLRAWLRLELGE